MFVAVRKYRVRRGSVAEWAQRVQTGFVPLMRELEGFEGYYLVDGGEDVVITINELNDIPVMVVEHHEAGYWVQKCRDAFDRLYQEGATRPRVMAIAVHPYISGQPFRIKYLEQVYDHIGQFAGVLHWNGAEIYRWYNAIANVHR